MAGKLIFLITIFLYSCKADKTSQNGSDDSNGGHELLYSKQQIDSIARKEIEWTWSPQNPDTIIDICSPAYHKVGNMPHIMWKVSKAELLRGLSVNSPN